MPTYDFRCKSCSKPFALRYNSTTDYANSVAHLCPHCGSAETSRRIGRVAIAKGENARMDAMAEDAFMSGVDENDPKSMGRLMKEMSREMGEDLGDEFNEVVDRLEKGESPESIEKSMPDIEGNLGAPPPIDAA